MAIVRYETLVWGDTRRSLAVEITDDETEALASWTSATVSVYNAGTKALLVSASSASVATATKPKWPPIWGSSANQIPEPTVRTTYLVSWQLTSAAGVLTVPAIEIVIVPRNPTL